MLKKSLLVSVFAMFLFVGIAQAQTENVLPNAGMLPDNPFYFLERLSEGVGTFFTFGDKAKAERFFKQSEERLAEAQALVNKDKTEKAEKIIEQYQEKMTNALERAKRAREKNEDVDDVLEHIAEATSRHQETLGDVYEKTPEGAREAIKYALEMSLKGYDTALESISKEKIEGVLNRVKMNVEEAKDRLEYLREKGIPVPGLHIYNEEDLRERMENMMDDYEEGEDMMNDEDMHMEEETHNQEVIREELKQRAEADQKLLEEALEDSNLTEKEREVLKQAGEEIREREKQRAEHLES